MAKLTAIKYPEAPEGFLLIEPSQYVEGGDFDPDEYPLYEEPKLKTEKPAPKDSPKA